MINDFQKDKLIAYSTTSMETLEELAEKYNLTIPKKMISVHDLGRALGNYIDLVAHSDRTYK